jgi:hypothetical protein
LEGPSRENAFVTPEHSRDRAARGLESLVSLPAEKAAEEIATAAAQRVAPHDFPLLDARLEFRRRAREAVLFSRGPKIFRR